MKIFEFNKYFPDEAACRKAFKEWRDKEGVACQHCGSHDVVWLESKHSNTSAYIAATGLRYGAVR